MYTIGNGHVELKAEWIKFDSQIYWRIRFKYESEYLHFAVQDCGLTSHNSMIFFSLKWPPLHGCIFQLWMIVLCRIHLCSCKQYPANQYYAMWFMIINLIYWRMYLWGTPSRLSLCEKCIFAGCWWMWMCLVTKSSYSILNIEFNLRLAGLGWAGLVRSSYNFVGELCCCFCCWSLVAAWSSLSNTLTLWAKMAKPELVLDAGWALHSSHLIVLNSSEVG